MRRWLILLVTLLSLPAWGVSAQDEDFDAQIRFLTRALEYVERPDVRVRLLVRRSQLYALDFRYDAAIADMDTAIAYAPDNPLLYVERGQRVLLLYEWDRVLADYNRALDLNPDYADAYYLRGVLHYTVLEREAAIADFTRYLALAPSGAHAADAARYITDIQVQLEALGE